MIHMTKKQERAQVRRLRKERNESGIRQFKALGLKTREQAIREQKEKKCPR